MKIITLFGILSIQLLSTVLAKIIDIDFDPSVNNEFEIERFSKVIVHVKNLTPCINYTKDEKKRCLMYSDTSLISNTTYFAYEGNGEDRNNDIHNFYYDFYNIPSNAIIPPIQYLYSLPKNEGGDVFHVYTLKLRLKGEQLVKFEDYQQYQKEIGQKTVTVQKGSVIQVELNRKREDESDPKGGYWYLDNTKEILNTKAIKPLNLKENDSSEDIITIGSSPLNVTSANVFKFLINDISDEPLPKLKFVHTVDRYVKPSSVNVILEADTNPVVEENLKTTDYTFDLRTINNKLDIEVEENSILTVHLKKPEEACIDFGTDEIVKCHWELDGGIVIYDSITSLGNEYNEENESEDFKFKIETFSDILPNLIFTLTGEEKSFLNRREEFAEVLLKLTMPHEVTVDLERRYYEDITVEKDMIIKVIIKGYTGVLTGTDWSLANADEIQRSKAVEAVGGGYLNTHKMDMIGGSSSYVFLFHVKETAGQVLPRLKFESRDKGKLVDTKEVILRAEDAIEAQEEECLVDGYKCCSNANTKIVTTDDSGNWGIEQNEWCFIKEEENQEEENQEEEKKKTLCDTKNLGYDCCQDPNSKVVVVDEESISWSIENNEWCILGEEAQPTPTPEPSSKCQSLEGYPVCEKTKTVEFTDSHKWGIENNEWCVLCD